MQRLTRGGASAPQLKKKLKADFSTGAMERNFVSRPSYQRLAPYGDCGATRLYSPLCSDRPKAAPTRQSEQEGREREGQRVTGERERTSLLRNTHTHTFANEFPRGHRDETLCCIAQSSRCCVRLCMCVCVRLEGGRNACVCVSACRHPSWPVLTCTEACLERRITCVVSGRPPSPPPSPHPLPPHLGPARGGRGPPGAGPHGGAEGPPNELRQRGGPLRSRALSDPARSQW